MTLKEFMKKHNIDYRNYHSIDGSVFLATQIGGGKRITPQELHYANTPTRWRELYKIHLKEMLTDMMKLAFDTLVELEDVE